MMMIAHFVCFYCQGLTEPNHGSDPAGMETTAEEVEDGYIVNGSKTWISNAPVACVPFFSILDIVSLASLIWADAAICSSSGHVVNGTIKCEGFFSRR